MIERLRLVPLPAAVAALGLGLAALAWLGLYGFAWNDYDDEARLAVDALVRGDLRAFAALSPAYGGSLLMRAPFALAVSQLGGGTSPSTARSPCLALRPWGGSQSSSRCVCASPARRPSPGSPR